jgi:hypothetical protein
MSAGELRVYDPDQVHVSMNGIPLSGFADGEFVTVETESATFEDVAGTDGEVTRSKTNDGRATVTVKLMQSSPSNDLLSVLHNLDKSTPGGVGVGPLFIRDAQGTTLVWAEKAWIQKVPDGSWDRTAKERSWVIRCANLISHHGGNA